MESVDSLLHRDWYELEIGVALPSWERLPSPVPFEVEGVRVQELGPRAYRATKRLGEEKLQRPHAGGLPQGSLWLSEAGSLASRVREARAWDALMRGVSAEAAVVERDPAKKVCLQRGGAPGWAILAPLIREGAPSMRAGFEALLHLLPSERVVPDATDLRIRYKRDTVHSYPDYGRTDLSLIFHALMARACGGPNFEALTRITERCCELIGEKGPLSAQVYTRTGPTAKTLDAVVATHAGPVTAARLTGKAPRRRVVFGMPSAGNMLEVAGAQRMKYALAQTRWGWHTGHDNVHAKLRMLMQSTGAVEIRQDDLSGYDTSVDFLHQEEVINIIQRRYVGDALCAFRVHWKDIPLQSAPAFLGDEAFLHRKHGQTSSGEIFTNIDGTLINAGRILMSAAAAMRCTAQQAAESWGRAWFFLCQGDDTVLGVPASWDWEAYVEESARLGYTAKVAEGAVFLMRYHDLRAGYHVALATRVLQQTWFNEYGGKTEEAELFALAARTEGFDRSPWSKHVMELLRQGCPALRATGARTWADLLKHVQDPGFQDRLAAGLKPFGRTPDRWKGVDPSSVSDAVAKLMGARVAYFETVPPQEAETAALRIAEWMGTPEDADGYKADPPVQTGAAAQYMEALKLSTIEMVSQWKEATQHDDSED